MKGPEDGRAGPGAHRVRGLEDELRRALMRLGATDRTVESVLASGCRLDGVGAAGLDPALARSQVRLRTRVLELAAALDRIAEGRYGTCEGCGGAIDDARLDLIPTTTRCRSCAP